MTYRWMAERSKTRGFLLTFWLRVAIRIDSKDLFFSGQKWWNGGTQKPWSSQALRLLKRDKQKKRRFSCIQQFSSVFEVLTLHLGPSQQRPQTRAPCPGEHRPCSNLALSLPWSSRSSMECIDRIRDGISLYWNHFIVLFNGFTSI